MRKIKKVLALTMASMLLVGSFTGCGGKDDSNTSSKPAGGDTKKETQDVSLTVWGPQESQEWLQKTCEDFNKAHEEYNIKFTFEVCAEGDAKDAVTKDIDNAADVFMVANDNLPTLVDAGAVAEFAGTYKDQIAAINTDTYMTSVTYQDKVYGVPYAANTFFMYYDKSVFSEDDVKSLDKMLEKGKVAFPLKNSWCIPSFYVSNGDMFKGGTDGSAGVTFADDNGVAVTKYLVSLTKNPNFSVCDFGVDPLNAGANATFSGDWAANDVKAILGDNLGVAVLPSINVNGQECQLKPYAQSKAICVNAKTTDRGNQQAATDLAIYLGSEDVQLSRYEALNTTPAAASLLDKVSSDPIVSTAMKQMEVAFVRGLLKEMDNTWAAFETMGNEIANGDVTEANAAEKTKTMADNITGAGL
ncbi:MAG: extracellular solute-binding protein [Lachnospiraceae bacterium]|nr:extracellular solute-binding protein [Lachnospiraceae bacterium]MEE1341500.1 extracellular solute-binding protein [Lachnospiraceae bacterium]